MPNAQRPTSLVPLDTPVGHSAASEHRVPERAHRQEVGKLLETNPIVAGARPDRLVGPGREKGFGAQARIRVAEIGQAELRGVRNDIDEKPGREVRTELVVKEHLGGAMQDPPRKALQGGLVGLGVGPALDRFGKIGARGLELGPRIVDRIRRDEQHVADRLIEPRRRQRGVADDGDAVGREAFADDAQERGADGGWSPGVDAVRDDDVECAKPCVGVREIARVKADVGRTAKRRSRARRGDRRRGKVEADKLGVRGGERHVDEIDALAAADFEDARPRHRRDRPAVQPGERAERSRIGVAEDLARIPDPIIDVGHACSLERDEMRSRRLTLTLPLRGFPLPGGEGVARPGFPSPLGGKSLPPGEDPGVAA